MKVTYLHQYFATPSMSGATRSYEMARRLVAAGHEVHMITSDLEGHGRPYETNEAGVRVTWIPVQYSNHMNAAARIRAFIAFAMRSVRIAANERADVIFATSTPLTIALPAVFAKWRLSAPMVLEVRDLWPEVPIALGILKNPILKNAAERLEWFAYKNATRVVTLSPGMTSGVAAKGYPETKIATIPNSCDFDHFDVDPREGLQFRASNKWLENKPLIVYTGTLGKVNGVGYLAHLASHVRQIDPDIRFLVVGSGREEEEIRILATRLGVMNTNFFMMPQVSKQEIPAILSAASMTTSTVIDVPALWNNSANKFFDSLAASRPIAINHEGWLAKLIRTNDIGVVLPPCDFLRAAESLVESLRNPNWLEGAGTRARSLGESEFSRDGMFAKLQEVLESVV